VFADILAKLTVEDQRAYARSMIDTKKIESLHTLLEYLEEAKLRQVVNRINALQKLGFILLMWTVVTMVPLVVVWIVPNNMV
jgi:beta-lactamase regulating signal transducer with metallopeptidase domain